MKKKISIIMALCFMLLVPNISVRAASNLKISGQTLPSTISVGSYFDCKGKITSDYTLTAVTGAIYSVDLKTTYCTKTVNPNAKSYSLYRSAIDSAMTFNKLGTGTYIYCISAKDSSNTSKTLINQQFNVGSPESTLSISGQTEPTDIKLGAYFDCEGKITSNYSITNVTGGIYSTDMKTTYYSKSVAPYTLSYSIRGGAIDMALLFNKLSTGTYVYKVTATDVSGKNIIAINKTFTVNGGGSTTTPTPSPAPAPDPTPTEDNKNENQDGNANSNPIVNIAVNTLNTVTDTALQVISNLSISGASKPSSISVGSYFDCKGKITSNFNITEVTGQITSVDGKDILYNKTVNPNKKSYSLAGGKIDKALLFNKLKKGNYIYKITAQDETGNRSELVKQQFQVSYTEISEKSISNIKKQIINTDLQAKKLSKMKSFYNYCGSYVYYEMRALGIYTGAKSKYERSASGNQWYNILKNSNYKKTTGGYTMKKCAGKDSLNKLTNNGKDTVYNIVVSYKNSYKTTENYGHVVFIHAVINGKVYYSESSNIFNTKAGKVIETTYSNFTKTYNELYKEPLGTVVFSK